MILNRLKWLLLLPLVAGCIIVHDEPVHRAPPPAPPPPAEPVVVSAETEEVDEVVYREYYGCTDAEIYAVPHYRRYYGCTDDDIFFLFFVCRLAAISFDVCFHSWYFECGRSYDRVVVYYRVPRERFFVAVSAGTSYPPAYAHAYGCYHAGTHTSTSFSNHEYVALVHMKIGCEYQGHPPAQYFARVQATGSTRKVLVESRDNCGRGGRSVTGGPVVVKAERPWTMPPQRKQEWRQEREQHVVKQETPFKQVHKEQVNKVELKEKEPHPMPAEPAHKPGTNPVKPGPQPREVEPRHELEKPHVQPPAKPGPQEPNRHPSDPPHVEKKPGPVENPPVKRPPPHEEEKPKNKGGNEEKKDKKEK